MTRPTKEQLEQARKLVAYDFESRRLDLPIHVAKAYEIVLSATTEPTDEELAMEVERAKVEYPGADDAYSFEQGYHAGARREGAR